MKQLKDETKSVTVIYLFLIFGYNQVQSQEDQTKVIESLNKAFGNSSQVVLGLHYILSTGNDFNAVVYEQLCPHGMGIVSSKIHKLCSIFIECGNGKLTIRSCKPTTVPTTDVCLNSSGCVALHDIKSIRNYFREYEFQSRMVIDKNVTKGEWDPSKANVHQTSTPEKNFFPCGNSTSGNFSFARSCMEYIECREKIPFVRKCTKGTAFNPLTSLCDKEQNDATSCEESERKNNSNNYENSKSRSGRAVNEGNKKEETKTLCSQSEEYYIQPNAKHCNKFETCSNGKITVKTCGLGTLFNPLSLVCDFPHNVDCESRLIDFSTYDCQMEDKYRTSHPENCKQFIECDRGTLHIKSCPPSTAFNYETLECDHSYKFKCKKPISLEHDTDVNYIQPTTRAKRSKRQSQALLNLDCSFNYIAPHPHFCNKFVECENGRIFVKDCGPGTAYNPKLGQCDWPYNVKQVDPEDCTRYRQCDNRGKYVEKKCGGYTIYDGERNKCVLPSATDVKLLCQRRDVDVIVTPSPS